jgi:hypothetical protein
MTLRYEIQTAIIAIRHGVPNLIRDEYLTNEILEIFEKRIDECKTIEEVKKMIKKIRND